MLTPGAWAAPTVTVLSPVAGATVSALTLISVTFNEAVAGVDASDLLINSDSATNVSGSGAGPYVFTFTQPAAGTVFVQFDADHGIAGVAASGALTAPAPWSYTLTDTIAPVVAQQTPAAGATVGALAQTEVLFSETVTGVDAADLLINGVPATAVTGSGFGPYLFSFPQPSVGTVTFSWAPGHGIMDAAAAPNNFAGAGWSVTRSAAGPGTLVLTEFLAANGTGLADENGDQEDWIEIYNPGASAVNLAGWALTDDAGNLGKWVLPNWTLDAGRYLVVFASGKNRRPAQQNAGETAAASIPRLHTSFKLNENSGYLAVVSPESPRAVVSAFASYPAQRTDYSFGPQPDTALRYFSPPTPGAANAASSLTAITPKVSASVSRGFFQDPFQLVLACGDATATIRYTTDGSEPTDTTGSVYSAPLTVSATTVLRAVAFNPAKIPSLPVTHSYIYLDQVLAQSNTPAGFPTNWGPNASFPGGVVPADYEVDTDPIRTDPTNAASAIDPVKQQRLKDGLRELPIVSLSVPMIDMFGVNGIYHSAHVQDKNYGYKKCSVEMILPDGSTAFTTICGVSGHGNASRDPLKNPKHGFQLKFKGDYGETSLKYRLYPDSPVQEFDDVILRPDFNSSWRHWSDLAGNASGAFQRSRATRTRDAFVKDTMRTMGGVASYHRFFHLFINGLYWGTYDFAEQPVDGFGKSYFGGSKVDYAVIHEGAAKNGADAVYTSMIAMPAITTNPLYEQMKGYLDVTEFMDYMLLHFYIGHQDWGNLKNWYAIRRRASAANPTEGKYVYIPWDDECTLLEPNVNRVPNGGAGSSTDVPSGLHTKLDDNAQYRLDFADRVHRQMIAPNGPLTAAVNIARWQKWQAVMDKPIVAESVRWGDYRRDVHRYSEGTYVLYARESHWLAENTRMTGTYFPARAATVLGFLQTALLYPTLAAPEYRQGTVSGTIVGTNQVASGYVVAMNRPGGAGTIYYTTDGNDPHILYSPTTGATLASVAATALAYSAPLTITGSTRIKSRILSGGVWSAMNEATFSTGVPAAPIRITEIMYNPPGGNAYEFLEIQNTGAAPVDMSGWSCTGMDYVFPLGTVLAAGDRTVLANGDGQSGAFASRYPGVSVAGWFGGFLDNGGERIAILDATGRTVVSVDYDDEAGWPTSPDGGGYSLEIIDANGDPDSPVNWKPSNLIKGTPGLANSLPPATSVVINEVLAENAGVVGVGSGTDDYIELKNTGGSAVDLVGWTVAASGGNAYTFSTSTVIGAGGFVVLPCSPGTSGARLPAALPGSGGFVQLKDSAGAQVDAIQYGNQLPNLAIGRVGAAWVLTAPTVASNNTEASTSPAAGNLVLNEWLSDSVPGGSDWIELYNKHATLPVALQGLYFQTNSQLYRYPALSFIAPLGWLRLFANEQPGAAHLDFKLPASGTALTILAPSGTVIDAVSAVDFGTPPQGVSRGRSPDGSATFATFTASPSPGATNYLNTWTGPVLNEVLARNVAGALAPWSAFADWVELSNPGGAFDLTGMKLGTSSDPATAWTFPAGTGIGAGGRLAVWCDPGQPASGVFSADMNTALTLGDTSGALYLFNAAGQLVQQVEWGFQIADKSVGLDSGVWKLLASPTRGLANAAAHALGAITQLRINEWMAQPVAGDDWFELYNLDPNPVNMAGLYLTDDPSEVGRTKFTVGSLSFIAGRGWGKWIASNTPSLGRDHVNFALDFGAEYLRLSNNDPGISGIDAVSFGTQALGVSEGRIPDGAANFAAMPGSPTPGAKNVLLPAPTITTDPLNQTVMTGANVNFTVAATGSAPLGYQWRFNNVDIPGETAATLARNGVTAANDGAYVCVVTNTAGSATSATATLTVQYSFAQWAALQNLTGPDALANADPDGDGISNLREFFHNLNPQLGATAADRAALPQTELEPATGTPLYLTLTYRRSARAVLTGAEHQLSPTLGAGTWGTVVPDVTESLSPDPVTGDPRVRVKFSIAPGEARKYLRLLLTQ